MDLLAQIKNTPKLQLILLLSIYYLVAAFHLPLTQSLYLLFFCLLFTVSSDLLFKKLKKRSFQIPYSAIITGLILTLIIDTSANIFQILIICASAMLIKNFLRFDKHIFNPAASGLLVGFFIFGLYPSWWAASFYTTGEFSIPNLFIISAVLLFGFVSLYRLKRYVTVASYLGMLGILSFIFSLSNSFSSLISLLFAPGTLFFALVMLPEPMTSPFKKVVQAVFGISVALIQILLALSTRDGLFNNLPDYSLTALLIANLGFFTYMKFLR